MRIVMKNGDTLVTDLNIVFNDKEYKIEILQSFGLKKITIPVKDVKRIEP